MSEILHALNQKIAKLEAMKRELVDDHIEAERLISLKRRVAAKPKKPKFSTGIEFFDEKMNGGFTEGSFVNIAGGNFTGKTHFVLTVLSNICKYREVLFFSFEMYENLIHERTKHFTDEQSNNFLIEQTHTDINDIEAMVRQYSNRGVDFFAIDSRMKIVVPGLKEEYQKNSEISRRLSKLTQETGAIIILINQISEADLRNNRPSLKGSGDQAYDSDVTLFILPHKDDINRRVMICEKDRINQKKWKHEYTLSDLTESKIEVIEFHSPI